MPDDQDESESTRRKYPNPREEDIMAGDRRISRPDSALPDWQIPDAAYRPIPIAWFAGAFLLQSVVMFAIFMLLISKSGYFTIAGAAIATGAIGAWTWDRGMKGGPTGWKAATIIMLVVQFALVSLATSGRL